MNQIERYYIEASR